MKVRWVTVGAFQENSYLLSDDAVGRGVLVDPGDEPDRIRGMIAEAGVTVEAIWLTHGHLDHIGAVQDLRDELKVPVLLHPLDLPVYQRAERAAALYGLPFRQPGDPDGELEEGQELRCAGQAFRVLHTPGHAPGHVVFIGGGLMLGGDLLFAGSIGRTDLPLSNPAHMEESLARVANFEPSLVVYPGHGPPTTIGHELDSNPFLSEFHAA